MFSKIPPFVPIYYNWIDGSIFYHPEEMLIEITKETDDAVIELATIWDLYEVSESKLLASVPNDEFNKKYKETLYFKYFNKTSFDI